MALNVKTTEIIEKNALSNIEKKDSVAICNGYLNYKIVGKSVKLLTVNGSKGRYYSTLFRVSGICDSKDYNSESRSDTMEIISDKKSTVIREHHYYGPYPYYPTEMPTYVR